VKFLVDNPLDPALADLLTAQGHDAVYVRSLGLSRAPDEIVFERAAAESRVVVSADTDFGTLLALTNARSPSVLLLRRGTPRRGAPVAALLSRVLPDVQEPLTAGAVVVIDLGRVRVRTLPVGG
jgi:predicted nuclease of predicted toxin-antitoxin system